jgi:hypothetical protein
VTACQLASSQGIHQSLPVLVNDDTSFKITIPPRGCNIPDVPICQSTIHHEQHTTYILILGMVPSGGVIKLALLNPDPSTHQLLALEKAE